MMSELPEDDHVTGGNMQPHIYITQHN